ncbi:hypothetical protein [Sphingomonas antarctica]|uniref:hypothetical protein n=1 Tax=Sphingomonas antarctica TaxID=2040274 RepID=UPI0039E8234E
MRQEIAYGLIILLMAGAILLIARWRHDSPERRYRRQQKRDRERYRAMRAEKTGRHDDRP